jgi:hypothetical protein
MASARLRDRAVARHLHPSGATEWRIPLQRGSDMHKYVLRSELSCCRIGEDLVFLDVGSDRYFRLPSSMEKTLAGYLQGDTTATADIAGLIERRILVERAASGTGSQLSIPPAARSAMEAPTAPRHPRAAELLEVLSLILRMHLALKHVPLKRVLDGLVARRHARCTHSAPAAASTERELADAASVYRQARLFVPVDMRCLPDSLALARFLSRRRLHANVVFGVALDPFSAHCWVQAGDLALNDTVGNVHAHTPIRVV